MTGVTAAEPGSTLRNPLVLYAADLDLSGLRAHCREEHRAPTYPRANLDLAGWHASQHHRYRPGHTHRDPPWVLIRHRTTGRTTGQLARPVGWYTGQGAVSREQGAAELPGRLNDQPWPPGRPALLGERHAPRTAAQWQQYDAGAVAADAAWDETGPWLTPDAMTGRDRHWVHGYRARYYERLPALYAREEDSSG